MDERSRTVGRVIAVMDQLSVSPRPLSNLELAVATDVPMSSMHRLLQKLTALGYIDCDHDTACYSVAPMLSELGTRLANVGGYSQPLRTLMGTIREKTGFSISVWVPSGAHVRLSAVLIGAIRGPTLRLPGEVCEPFTTPGLAIATQLSDSEVRKLASMARRRRVPLGRKFKHISQVKRSIASVAQRGYATGYNMMGDGWGMLAWPIPISIEPLRPGALAVGAPVAQLREQQNQLLEYVNRMRETYVDTLTKDETRDAATNFKLES
ncbi:MAG: helix-turn-helix domain-containing protein [Lysobacterales bacterium]